MYGVVSFLDKVNFVSMHNRSSIIFYPLFSFLLLKNHVRMQAVKCVYLTLKGVADELPPLSCKLDVCSLGNQYHM